jgi:structural maintenance of chromosome 1
MEAFNFVSENIDNVYKELTKSKTFPVGGTAYLSLENSDEPYLGGIKYHAMPPLKRFREMELLSGGEKTVVALALLFTLQQHRSSPFFLLDEVDAALDNANVARIVDYMRSKKELVQFIVISLKGLFYERGEALCGVYRDPKSGSSNALTLDLSAYSD